jgi:hypothetical protein
MFDKKKESFDVDKFWRDYEASIGETILAKSLGQYISGWPGLNFPLWGLAIATSGGFRFHHFPHEGWLMAISRVTTGGEAPKEKTFFIPADTIISVELLIEKRWWKKIFTPSNPTLVITCRTQLQLSSIGEESKVVIETDRSAAPVLDALKAGVNTGINEGAGLQTDNSGIG